MLMKPGGIRPLKKGGANYNDNMRLESMQSEERQSKWTLIDL